MKNRKIFKQRASHFLVLVFTLFASISAIAQDTGPAAQDAPVESSDTVWYSQSWFWVIIVALVLAALVYFNRSNRRKALSKGTEKGIR